MLVTMKSILDHASQNNYAIPAFDVLDHASAEGVLAAAEAQNRPVIFMVPEAWWNQINVDSFIPFLIQIVKTARVPVAIELDHGKTYAGIVKAIHCGFTGVMIDGSVLSLEENINITKKVVEVAHAAGVSVEAEIGHVAGGEGNLQGNEVDESRYTKVADAIQFVKETGVDALAVAIGTVHGAYKGIPKLDIERLAEIKAAVGIPLVIHGGSGVSDVEFVKAIENGINKINIFTEISCVASNAALELAQKNDYRVRFPHIVQAGKDAVEKISAHYLELFCLGK